MRRNTAKGFSIVELLVAMGIFSLLFGFIWLNLLGSRGRASQSSTIDVFTSDLRAMQLKAMKGDSEGRVDTDAYGVLLKTTTYTLFHGSTYNPDDPSNRTVSLGDGESFNSVLFPGNSIVFAKGSGELVNYDPAQSSVSLTNMQSNTQKTLQLNKYGVITSSN
ncbi:MAG: type II secretion system protein [Candidatus Levybacteria bacterium]|nr:type II secretion system protein [Candidatus Levybacteria bacterium]